MASSCEVVHQPLQGDRKAEVIENGGMKLIGQMTHNIRQFHNPVLYRADGSTHVTWGEAELPFYRFNIHGQKREPLIDVIVQIARDTTPLFLLHAQQLKRQLLQRLPAAFERRLGLHSFSHFSYQ
jgi:hypothetical protein